MTYRNTQTGEIWQVLDDDRGTLLLRNARTGRLKCKLSFLMAREHVEV